MPKYQVRTNYDTGIIITVNANSEEEAIEIALKKRQKMLPLEFLNQIQHNLEEGETEAFKEE